MMYMHIFQGASECILDRGPRVVGYFSPRLLLCSVTVEVYIGAFIKAVILSFRRRRSKVIMNIRETGRFYGQISIAF